MPDNFPFNLDNCSKSQSHYRKKDEKPEEKVQFSGFINRHLSYNCASSNDRRVC